MAVVESPAGDGAPAADRRGSIGRRRILRLAEPVILTPAPLECPASLQEPVSAPRFPERKYAARTP